MCVAHAFVHSKVLIPGLGWLARAWLLRSVAADCVRLCGAPCSLAWQKKMRSAIRLRSGSRFSARLGSSGRSRDASRTLRGSIFENEMTSFSTFVASGMHASARPPDPYETLRGRTNFKLRAFCDRPNIGRKLASNAARRRVRAGNALDKGPEGSTWRSRLPTWRPEPPTGWPRRPTWRPRRPNLAFWGRSKRVPERPRAGPERPDRPRSKFRQFVIDFRSIFSTIFSHCVWPSDCVKRFFFARSLIAFDRQNVIKKTRTYRFRLAFCCSSLPVQFPRCNPQLASQRFTRCSKVNASSSSTHTNILKKGKPKKISDFRLRTRQHKLSKVWFRVVYRNFCWISLQLSKYLAPVFLKERLSRQPCHDAGVLWCVVSDPLIALFTKTLGHALFFRRLQGSTDRKIEIKIAIVCFVCVYLSFVFVLFSIVRFQFSFSPSDSRFVCFAFMFVFIDFQIKQKQKRQTESKKKTNVKWKRDTKNSTPVYKNTWPGFAF